MAIPRTLRNNFRAAVKLAVKKGFKVTYLTDCHCSLVGKDDSTWTLAIWLYNRCLAWSHEDDEPTQCISTTQIKNAISHAAELCEYLAADENNEG